jgi:hypothetical protein
MRNYYQLTAPIAPGWQRVTSTAIRPGKIVGTVGADLVNPRAWKDAPHVFLANTNMSDLKTVAMFTTLYGPLDDDVEPGDSFEVPLERVAFYKDQLLRAWRERDASQLWILRGLELSARYDLELMWHGRGIELRPADIWTYTRLLLTRDLSTKRARICPNLTCPAPHFVARRNNQKFCSLACRGLVGQRNFRKRWPKRRAK